MSVAFTKDNLEKCKKLIAKYEKPKCALLPILYVAQEQFGYLTPEVLECVAKVIEVPAARVFEAASFYTMFKKKDMGRWCLQVCNNVTCSMMGAESLIKVAKEELGLSLHQVGEDKRFSLLPVQCLGACDKAPVVQVNEDYVENLNEESFRKLLRGLSQENIESAQEVNL